MPDHKKPSDNNRIKNNKPALAEDSDRENLGLDADHSSENAGWISNLNNDNDRVSHNPDGEDDDHDTQERPGYSPLMDK